MGEGSCHCLLVETHEGLVLVDTGLGLRNVGEQQRGRTAIRQIERLGLDPDDVRHIVLTHLGFDHAGGLDDFPRATVHVLASERADALARRSTLDRARHRPSQGSTRPRWRTYGVGGERWYGFERVRALEGVTDDIVMISLCGHTRGHAGVAVRGDTGWLLLAGDAYVDHRELDMANPWCPLRQRAYRWLMEKDRPARQATQVRLRSLALTHGHEVTIFCSHDREELERLAGRRASMPAAAVTWPAAVGAEPWAAAGLEL